jgi:ATP-binding cassette subfamily F protein 3
MSREALENAILGYDGTVLVISHDRYFLNKVINKIYELGEDGVKEYLGNYSYYAEKKKNPLRFQEEEEIIGKTKTQIQNEKKKKRDLEKAEKDKKLKFKNIEIQISDLEKFIVDLQNQLCLEEIYSDVKKSENINKQLLEAQNTLDNLYVEWESFI